MNEQQFRNLNFKSYSDGLISLLFETWFEAKYEFSNFESTFKGNRLQVFMLNGSKHEYKHTYKNGKSQK